MQLFIKKKFQVPTKFALVHNYRSDWKTVIKLTEADCDRCFKYINGSQGFEYDSQLIHFVFNQHGEGDYFILMTNKGQHGFRSFLHFRCFQQGYLRIKSKPRTKGLKRVRIVNHTDDSTEVKELEVPDARIVKRGCSPTLISCTPIFNKIHRYSEVPNSVKKKEIKLQAEENLTNRDKEVIIERQIREQQRIEDDAMLKPW